MEQRQATWEDAAISNAPLAPRQISSVDGSSFLQMPAGQTNAQEAEQSLPPMTLPVAALQVDDAESSDLSIVLASASLPESDRQALSALQASVGPRDNGYMITSQSQ